ncbi:MAG: hypothetical protein NBKEAIPA_01664 [Nitrospirae bacterium]|nr:hypothetical protein [Nitrospirota bacterium]
MVRPEDVVGLLGDTKQQDPHQGRQLKVEIRQPIALHQSAEPRLLLACRAIPRIHFTPGQGRGRQDDLNRRGHFAPEESRPQQRVPIHDLLPRAAEHCEIKVTLHPPTHLLDIDTGDRGIQAVEEEPLLQRAQRVDILQVRAGRFRRRPRGLVDEGTGEVHRWR